MNTVPIYQCSSQKGLLTDAMKAELATLLGALSELDVLAGVTNPARLVAAAQLAASSNDEIMQDLRAYLANVTAFLDALGSALP